MAKVKKETAHWLAGELFSLYLKHPSVAVKLEIKWGTVHAYRYFQVLLEKDRTHRNGFPIDSYVQIMKLFLVHVSDYGEFGEPVVIARPNINKDTIVAA